MCLGTVWNTLLLPGDADDSSFVNILISSILACAKRKGSMEPGRDVKGVVVGWVGWTSSDCFLRSLFIQKYLFIHYDPIAFKS